MPICVPAMTSTVTPGWIRARVAVATAALAAAPISAHLPACLAIFWWQPWRRPSWPARGSDLRYTMELTLEEAVRGSPRRSRCRPWSTVKSVTARCPYRQLGPDLPTCHGPARCRCARASSRCSRPVRTATVAARSSGSVPQVSWRGSLPEDQDPVGQDPGWRRHWRSHPSLRRRKGKPAHRRAICTYRCTSRSTDLRA